MRQRRTVKAAITDKSNCRRADDLCLCRNGGGDRPLPSCEDACAFPMVVLEDRLTDRPFDIALVLSGGNALGAYQGGAYQALHDRGMQPSWIAGASAGAVNGAMICGNAADRRVDRLRTLWGCGPIVEDALDLPGMVETSRRSLSAMATLAFGHPGFFTPRHLLGPWWNPLGNYEPPSLYDLRPLEDTLRKLVDFDLLNAGAPRLTITAVDVRSGEDVAFRSGVDPIGPAHVRASASLLPVFPPVAIGDRLLADAGISANLPLDVVLSEERERPLLCIAIDLLPLRATWPATLGDVASRAQDLVFATQSRRALAAWQAIFDARGDEASSVTLLHIAYREQGEEVAGKAFDFSTSSSQGRWRAGMADMARMLEALDRGEIKTGRPGLTIYQAAEDNAFPIERLRPPMQPVTPGAKAKP